MLDQWQGKDKQLAGLSARFGAETALDGIANALLSALSYKPLP